MAKVVKYSVTQLKDHRLIFISEIALDGISYPTQKIGSPVNVENDLSNSSVSDAQTPVNTFPNNNTNMGKQPNPTVSNTNQITNGGSLNEVSVQPISAISPYHNKYSSYFLARKY